ALDVPEVTQSLAEGLRQLGTTGQAASQVAYSRDFARLRLRSDRRKNETDNEHDREPDPPHGHLAVDGWRESSRPELLAARAVQPLPRRPLGRVPRLRYKPPLTWRDERRLGERGAP